MQKSLNGWMSGPLESTVQFASKAYNQKNLILFLLVYYCFLPICSAGDRILETININEHSNYSIIDLRLNQPVNLIFDESIKKSDLIRVRFSPLSSVDELDNSGFTHFESIPWEPTAKVPLYEVTIDTDNAILFRFKREVKYQLLPTNSAFHVLLKIFHPQRIIKLPVQNKGNPQKPGNVVKKNKTKKNKKIIKNPLLDALMEEARKAMLSKDYARAIQLYSKVVFEGEKSGYYKEALEYLGLAREKNLQFAHAKKLYETYLQHFPEGEDAERVRQRLMGIITAKTEPKEKLKKGKSKQKNIPGGQWDVFGSFYQLYNRFETKVNNAPFRLNRSSLQNGVNLNAKLDTQEFLVSSKLSGRYNKTVEGSRQDGKRLYNVLVKIQHKPSGALMQLGRQTNSTGGVLGRFDGGYVSWPVLEDIHVNLVGGFPVLSSKQISVNEKNYFYGINTDFLQIFDSLDINTFYIEQYNHGLLDRRAIGGSLKFFQENKSFYSFIDYDIYYSKLNTILFTGQWFFENRSTISLSYNYHTTPYLTTSSALQGQGFRNVNNLADLRRFFSIDEIKQLAIDRTAITQTMNIAYSTPLSEKLQLNLDFRVNKTSGSRTSGGVTGSPGTGYQYRYLADLVANNVFKTGDIYVAGVRLQDMDQSVSATLRMNARYPVTQSFRINPRVRFIFRKNNDGTKRYSIRPAVRSTYRLFKGLQLELEAGGEWVRQQRIDTVTNDKPYDKTLGYYLIAGYRYIF